MRLRRWWRRVCRRLASWNLLASQKHMDRAAKWLRRAQG